MHDFDQAFVEFQAARQAWQAAENWLAGCEVALKAGDASEPLMLPEGCFILFAEERKFAGIQAIDEVRDQIERELIRQMSRSGQERWLERLRRNGYVKHY